MKLSIQYVTAAVLLVSVTLLLQHSSRAEDTPDRPGFTAFPLEVKDRESGRTWIGREVALDPDVLAVLRVDDYMMRVYVTSEAGRASRRGATVSDKMAPDALRLPPHVPVWLYTGYYQSQRSGVTYHSPLNCLPGSGWSILSRDVVPVSLPPQSPGQHGTEFRVNKVLIQKGLETQLILYWYQDRGRTITSEYWAKAYLLIDAITRNRTDGALVRISVPVSASADPVAVANAFSLAQQFLQDAVPRLMAHLPI